jgi:hypothetical protein
VRPGDEKHLAECQTILLNAKVIEAFVDLVKVMIGWARLSSGPKESAILLNYVQQSEENAHALISVPG